MGGRQETTVRRLISRFTCGTSGATAIEYALIAAGLSIVILVTVNGLGSKLNTSYTSVNTALK